MAHLYWIYPLNMMIFHSYVSLPEGIYIYKQLLDKIGCYADTIPFFVRWSSVH